MMLVRQEADDDAGAAGGLLVMLVGQEADDDYAGRRLMLMRAGG